MGRFSSTDKLVPLQDFIYTLDQKLLKEAADNTAKQTDDVIAKANEVYLKGQEYALNALEPDKPFVAEYLKNNYNQVTEDITNALLKDPTSFSKQRLELNNIGRKFVQDASTGNLSIWSKNFKDYNEQLKKIDEEEKLFMTHGGKHGVGISPDDANMWREHLMNKYVSEKIPKYKETNKAQNIDIKDAAAYANTTELTDFFGKRVREQGTSYANSGSNGMYIRNSAGTKTFITQSELLKDIKLSVAGDRIYQDYLTQLEELDKTTRPGVLQKFLDQTLNSIQGSAESYDFSKTQSQSSMNVDQYGIMAKQEQYQERQRQAQMKAAEELKKSYSDKITLTSINDAKLSNRDVKQVFADSRNKLHATSQETRDEGWNEIAQVMGFANKKELFTAGAKDKTGLGKQLGIIGSSSTKSYDDLYNQFVSNGFGAAFNKLDSSFKDYTTSVNAANSIGISLNNNLDENPLSALAGTFEVNDGDKKIRVPAGSKDHPYSIVYNPNNSKLYAINPEGKTIDITDKNKGLVNIQVKPMLQGFSREGAVANYSSMFGNFDIDQSLNTDQVREIINLAQKERAIGSGTNYEPVGNGRYKEMSTGKILTETNIANGIVSGYQGNNTKIADHIQEIRKVKKLESNSQSSSSNKQSNE